MSTLTNALSAYSAYKKATATKSTASTLISKSILKLIFKSDSTTVTLAIPPQQKIDFTGPREIAKIDIPGFRPQYQDMGYGERTAKWQGVVIQEDGDTETALAKIETLRKLMDTGADITFTHGIISVKVLIRELNYSYLRDDYVRYDITLLQKEDITSNGTTNKPQSSKATPGASRGETGSDIVSTLTTSVLQGENVKDVCNRLYGSSTSWTAVALLNNLKSTSISSTIKSITVPANSAALKTLQNYYTTKKSSSIPTIAASFVLNYKKSS